MLNHTWTRVASARLIVVVALAAAVIAPSAGRAAVILDSLIVRVYDNTGVRDSDRTAALRRAAEIFFRAELDIEWVSCPARREGWACALPPAPQELIVRLINTPGPEPAGAQRLFSQSVIDEAAGEGILATVYIDQVNWLSNTTKVERTTVLGRAIAHELGHLILGTKEHTASGLMRDVWTAQELLRNQPEDWHFSASQLTALHTRLAHAISVRAAARRSKTNPSRPRS